MSRASAGAAEALRFADAVEKATFAATEETATKAARAASLASKAGAEIAEARETLSETSDRERLKRLVIEIARLERERSEYVAEYKVSAKYPVFTMVDNFGLDAAEESLKSGNPAASGRQRGGASEEPGVIPPFHFHTGGDQLQWPFQAGS
jgi:hypothetical protein